MDSSHRHLHKTMVDECCCGGRGPKPKGWLSESSLPCSHIPIPWTVNQLMVIGLWINHGKYIFFYYIFTMYIYIFLSFIDEKGMIFFRLDNGIFLC